MNNVESRVNLYVLMSHDVKYIVRKSTNKQITTMCPILRVNDTNLYDFEKTMKVIANLSVSAPTNLTVCGNFTFLMAMWSEGMRVYGDAILVACMCGSQTGVDFVVN